MRLRACPVVVLLACCATAAGAVEAPRAARLVRTYDWTHGFPWSCTVAVEQDARGFLWVTATSGLFRFDGTRAVRVADAYALALGSTAAGRIVVYTASGPTFEGTPSGLVPLDDGKDVEPDRVSTVAVASDGTPWRVRGGILERLGSDRRWTALPVPTSANDRPRWVRPGRNGRVLVLAPSSVWMVEPDGTTRNIATVDTPFSAIERADGTVVVGANQWPAGLVTRIFEIAHGATRLVYEERGSRLVSLVERGEEIWVSMDHGLQALGVGYRPAGRLDEHESPGAGNLLVDREGSLWMSTFQGLAQLPEPDVFALLPSRIGITRHFVRTPVGVWGTFWGALAFLRDDPEGPRLEEKGPHFAGLCGDGAGRVWTAGGKGILRLEPDGRIGPSFAAFWDPHSCGEGKGGRRWIASSGSELWTVAPSDDRPRRVPIRIDGASSIAAATEDREGDLWVATGPRLCAAPAKDVLGGAPVRWRCERIAGGDDVFDVRAMPSGDLWAITIGVHPIRRRNGGAWDPVPGAAGESSWMNSITPSPSGGVWIAGQGTVVRVAERPDLPDGWEVLERPTAWNGVISLNVVAVQEDLDGTLWLGSELGVQKVRPEIRRRRADPPVVELVEGSVMGAPLDPAGPIELPYAKNRLVAHFAALSYREPGAARYRMRLHDKDAWSAPGPDGRFTFVDLAPGTYDLEVAATLDGTRWTDPAVRLPFRVLRPWYVEPWFLAGCVFFVAASGHLGYRLRVRRRLARERQRVRIAMDLHDEVGSGLGTIAVLAGIAGRSDLPPARRKEVASRIASVSQELARSLGDIVWSLRTSSGSLAALWNQLLERAGPLFPSESPRIVFEAPQPVPEEPLSLVVRRNLHLVAYEALHNAARHAGARRVVLRLARDGGGWRLEVEDDGRGLAPDTAAPSVRRGLGIEAMRRRVEEMQGTIAWERAAGGGTKVSVRFRTGEG